MQVTYRMKVNLAARRLLSFPHMLVVLWMLVMLWGERWTFKSQVQNCDWDHWEDWVSLQTSLVKGALYSAVDSTYHVGERINSLVSQKKQHRTA